MRTHTIHTQKPIMQMIQTGVDESGKLSPQKTITKYNGNLQDRFANYLRNADNGKGGDITRGGAPLKTFAEWMGS